MRNPAAFPTPVFARAANDHLHTLKTPTFLYLSLSPEDTTGDCRGGGVEINQPIVPEHLVSAVIAATAWGHPAQTRVFGKVYIMPCR